MTDPARIAQSLQDSQSKTRCELTDLFPDQCACVKHRNIQEEARKKGKRATWRGVCRCCLVNPIEPGALIEPFDGGWKLVDCDA